MSEHRYMTMVDAFQWFSDSKEYPLWFNQAIYMEDIEIDGDRLYIQADGGSWIVESGDYIVRYSDGEISSFTKSKFNERFSAIG